MIILPYLFSTLNKIFIKKCLTNSKQVGGIKTDKFDSYLESDFKSAYHGFEKADENEDGWIDSVEIINVTMKMHKNMLSEYEIDHPKEDIKFGLDEMENEKVDLKMFKKFGNTFILCDLMHI